MTQTSAPTPQPQPRSVGSSSPAVVPLKKSAEPAKVPPKVPGSPVPASAGSAHVAPVPEEQSHHYEPSFWHKKWVMVGMPIATSVIFHAGLLIVMAILAVIFSKTVLITPTKDQTTIPDSNFADQTPPGGVQFNGLNNDPLHQAFQNKDPNHGSVKGWAEKASANVNPTQAAGGGSGDTSDSLIAVGSGGFGSGKHGSGGGTGDNSGSGSGDGGPLAMFGHPGGGGLGPHGLVFGNGGNAYTIAFVCDASGSMMEKMEALKRELSKAVEGLHAFQKFNIIFFQDASCASVDPSALILATPENKRKAESFLTDVSTSGSTNPIPGLDLAFREHPQLIYLLTDGDFPNNDAVKAEIKKLNPDGKVKINTIAFIDAADHDTDFKKLLTDISKESGGQFRSVNEEDLQ